MSTAFERWRGATEQLTTLEARSRYIVDSSRQAAQDAAARIDLAYARIDAGYFTTEDEAEDLERDAEALDERRRIIDKIFPVPPDIVLPE
jgi:hypothetical protein